MRFNAHAKIEIAAATLLLLASCNDSTAYSSEDAYDLADAAQANSANALSAVDRMESRIVELEEKVKLNERNIETAFSNAEADREVANSNAEISNRALDRLDRVEARLGF